MNATAGLFGKPAEEKMAEPATTVNSVQEYSPTVTGKTALVMMTSLYFTEVNYTEVSFTM